MPYDPYCKGCAYRKPLEGPGSCRVCAYSLVTGHLRGCPAGTGCPHKTKKLPKGMRQVERSNRLLDGRMA